jgi:integrase
MLAECSLAAEKISPGWECMFPSVRTGHCSNSTLGKLFDMALGSTGFFGKTSKKPTCHGLRRAFAVNSLRQCLERGQNPERRLVCPSEFMGHASPQGTRCCLHMSCNRWDSEKSGMI